ncbi:MAG TPA: hypothetical protein VFW11_08685 [Cyclobacteriaceae bacterium]|nr:hypothetical protein [Cyclobacteriaceae bacterium]
MKTIYKLFLVGMLVSLMIRCSEESDMAIKRVVSPVVIETKDVTSSQVEATFFELDKSGILDYTVGIDSIAVPNLAIEVFASGASVGIFTTDGSGAILVEYAGVKPNEYAGTYKGVTFRIKK